MDLALIGAGGVTLLLGLICLGVPVAYAAAASGLAGIMLVRGPSAALALVGGVPYSVSSSYTLSVLPLFVAIGFLAYYARVTTGAFEAARAWFGRVPGGLAISTIMASAGFSAISGSSVASAAIFTSISIPEMENAGYKRAFAAGTVAAGGTLAALIPPSILLVVYALLVEQSVGRLLVAAIIPGALSVLIYGTTIIVFVLINPSWAPKLRRTSFRDKVAVLPRVWGIFAVIFIVLFGLYTGWTTPTEAASLAVGVILIMAISQRMTAGEFRDGMLESIKTTAMLFGIIWGVGIFSRFLAYTGIPLIVTDSLVNAQVSTETILIGVVLLYLVLGMFLDGMGMLALTLPILYPAMVKLDVDPLWFGIFVVKMVEIGLLTPPVGLNCYVVNGVRPDIPMKEIFQGVVPFLFAELVFLVLLILFPEIVTFLPNQMR